jgi:hypothetical protein
MFRANRIILVGEWSFGQMYEARVRALIGELLGG